MNLLRITDDATRPDIEEAIGHLRAKLASTDDAGLRDEITADIDEALELWAGLSLSARTKG